MLVWGRREASVADSSTAWWLLGGAVRRGRWEWKPSQLKSLNIGRSNTHWSEDLTVPTSALVLGKPGPNSTPLMTPGEPVPSCKASSIQRWGYKRQHGKRAAGPGGRQMTPSTVSPALTGRKLGPNMGV